MSFSIFTSSIFESNKSGPVDNCALLFNLTFCDSVAYAAPANPQTSNTNELLAQKYDNFASSLYQNFTFSLQQIPCNTTSSAQYSLARNCNDCDKAYRTWLCSVTIPRCEDFSNNSPYLLPRAVNESYAYVTVNKTFNATAASSNVNYKSSRNPMIDNDIRPGPYKEMLPCKDICYDLVRSCPAALQFACPLEGHGLNYSYGSPSKDVVSCNSPWYSFSGAAGPRMMNPVALCAAFAVWVMVTIL